MKSLMRITFFAALLSISLVAQENLNDFQLSDEEKRELERIEKIKEDFKKRFPDWVDTGEEGEIIDMRLGKSIEKRKTDYIKKQKALLKRIKEEEKKQAKLKKEQEAEAKRLETQLKQEEEQKRIEESERKKAEAIQSLPINVAMRLLKEKRYKEAYEKFYALFLEDTANPRINFYLGLSASGAKMYESAVSAYERVLIAEPNHTRARLELARVYFFLKMFAESEKEFQKILESGETLPPQVLANVQKFMVAIERTKIRNHFNSAVMVGVQYDSNINNDVGENNYVIDPNVLPGGVKGGNPKSDAIHQEMANLNHVYDFGKLGDYYMQNSLTVFAQNYTANPENNILFASLATGVEQRTRELDVITKLHYDSIQIDGQNYMSVTGIELGGAIPLAKTIRGELKLRNQQKTFADNSDNDSGFYEIYCRLKKRIEGTKDTLSGRLLYSDESAKDSPTTDRSIVALRVGYQKEFNKKNVLTTTLSHRMISYKTESRNEKWQLEKRIDSQSNLSLNHMYKLDKTMMLNGLFTYINNGSSHAAFDYDKMLLGVNMLVLF